jgi:hypothetical protein
MASIITLMSRTRDPVSLLLDRGARDLLTRAYSVPAGTWVMTRLADPPREQAYGIRLMGPDNAPTASGTRNNAHTRWGRAFIRALYYQHKWHGDKDAGGFRPGKRAAPYSVPLEVQWGARKPAVGVIPAGRAVRIRVAYGGQAKARAVRKKADVQRIFDDDGRPAGRWCDTSRLDW